jgi:hypothetical protein
MNTPATVAANGAAISANALLAAAPFRSLRLDLVVAFDAVNNVKESEFAIARNRQKSPRLAPGAIPALPKAARVPSRPVDAFCRETVGLLSNSGAKPRWPPPHASAPKVVLTFACMLCPSGGGPFTAAGGIRSRV